MDPEVENELNQRMQDLADMFAGQTNNMSGMNDTLDDLQRSLSNFNNTVNKSTELTKKESEVDKDIDKSYAEAKKKIEEAKRNKREAYNKAGYALKNFTKSLISSEAGVSKYGKSVSALGSAAFSIGKNFGMTGIVIGGTIAALGKLVHAAMAVDDNIISLRGTIAKSAGVFPVSSEELGKLAKEARFSIDNMEKLGREIDKNASNMTALGTNANRASYFFMQMAKVDDDTRREFGRMGISQDRLLQLQGMYVENQAVSGQYMRQQTMTAEQARAESITYARTLISLSSLTGKSAEELQKEIDAIQEEYEEQVQTAQENIKIKKLRAEGKGTEADRLQAIQKNRKDTLNVITAMYGKETASQLGRVMRTGVIDAHSAPLAQLRFKNGKTAEQYAYMLKNSTNLYQDLNGFIGDMDESLGSQAEVFKMPLQYQGEELGKKLGAPAEAIQRSNRRIGQSAEERDKKFREIFEGSKQGKPGDPLFDSVENIRSVQREAQAGVQGFLENVDPLRNGFVAITESAFAAATAIGLYAARNKIKSMVGGILGAGSGAAEDTVEGVAKKGGLQSLFTGLKALGAQAKPVLKGAGVLAGVVAILGAGTGVALWEMSLGIKQLGKGFESFGAIKGDNLLKVGKGVTSIGLGIAALVATLVNPLTFVSFFSGGQLIKLLKQIQDAKLDTHKISENSKAFTAYTKNVLYANSEVVKNSAIIINEIGKNLVFNSNTLSKLQDFWKTPLDPERTKLNTTSFVNFVAAFNTITTVTSKITRQAIQGAAQGVTQGLVRALLPGAPGAPGPGAPVPPPPPGALGDIIKKIIKIESGGSATAQAKTSTAYGLGQLTKSTFEGIAKQKGSPVAGMTWEQYKSDPKVQMSALSYLVQQEAEFLQKNRIPVSATSIYLAHFLGMGGARQLYNHSNDTPVSQAVSGAALNANKSVFAKAPTVGALKHFMGAKVGEPDNIAMAKKGGLFSGPYSGYPMELHGTEIIIPMDENSILGYLATSSVQDLEGGVNKIAQPTGNKTYGSKPASHGINRPMINSLANKFDRVINTIENTTSINKKIMKHSMV